MKQRWLQWTAACAVLGLTLAWPGSATQDMAYAESKAAKDNVTLLAQVTCGEARGESYEGKVAVAAVILNRTLDKRFPDSVAGVVYQTNAFESVDNGEIYRNTTAECYKAARAAISGWDPTNGAVIFYAPAKTSNAYVWSRPIVRVIGRHNFAK